MFNNLIRLLIIKGLITNIIIFSKNYFLLIVLFFLIFNIIYIVMPISRNNIILNKNIYDGIVNLTINMIICYS